MDRGGGLGSSRLPPAQTLTTAPLVCLSNVVVPCGQPSRSALGVPALDAPHPTSKNFISTLLASYLDIHGLCIPAR